MQNTKFSGRTIQYILVSVIFILGIVIAIQMSMGGSPPMTLAILAAIPVLILLIKYPWLAISIFLLLIPLENLYVYKGSLTASTTKLFGALLVFLVITSGSLKYISEAFRNTKGMLILLFGGIALLSIMISNDTRSNMSAVITLWLSIVSYFVLIMMVRDIKTLNLATIALITGGVLSVLSPFLFGTGSSGRSDILQRFGGLWGDQNEFAAMLLILIPLSLAIFLNTQRKILKLMLLTCSVILLIGLLLTYSRGGYLSFGVMMMLTMFKFVSGKNRLKILAISIPCLIIASTIFYYTFAEEFIARMETLRFLESRESVRAEGSLSLRYQYYFEIAPKVFAEHPVFGVGFRGFINHNPFGQVTHNTYLEVLTGSGLVGFIPFMAILYLSWREIRRVEKYAAKQKETYLWSYAQALELGFISYFLAGIFISLDLSKMTWLIITLSAIIFNISRIHFLADNRKRAESEPPHQWAEYGMPGQRNYGSYGR